MKELTTGSVLSAKISSEQTNALSRCARSRAHRGGAWPAVLITVTMVCLLIAHSRYVAPVAARTSDTAVVRCDPASPLGAFDSPLVVDIFIENVVNLYGADIQMSFDPALVQVQDTDPALSGTQLELLRTFFWPDFIFRNEARNEAGTLWYAATQLNPRPPSTGSGPVARVTFMPVASGNLTLTFTSQMLVTREGTTIPAKTQDCVVTLSPTYTVWLPLTVRP